MSSHQMSQYLHLLLAYAYPLRYLPLYSARCVLGDVILKKRKKGHDIVVEALAHESRQLGFGAVDLGLLVKSDTGRILL